MNPNRPARAVLATVAMMVALMASSVPAAATGSTLSIAWKVQPADATAGEIIRGAEGAAIAVRLSGGDKAHKEIVLSIKSGTDGAVLGGVTTATTNEHGVATFAPTIDRAGTYTLKAAFGSTSAISHPFDVDGRVVVDCDGPCEATNSAGGTTVSVQANATGSIRLDVGEGAGDVSCNDRKNRFYEATNSEPIEFDVTGGVGFAEIEVRIPIAGTENPLREIRVCFSSPESAFINRYGRFIAKDEAGIIPPCWWRPANAERPGLCQFVNRVDGDQYVIRFRVPAGDPRARL